MTNEQIVQKLKGLIPEDNIYLNEPMNKHTSFKIGGNADIFIKINDLEYLKYVLQIKREDHFPLQVVGNGTNLLVKDGGIRGITIKLQLNEISILKEDEENIFVTAEGGILLSKLSYKLLEQEISGFEFAARNSWYNRWSSKNECRSIWRRV